MKCLFVMAVLATLSVSYEAAVVQGGPVSRLSLNTGYIGPGDRLLYRNYFYKAPYPNAVQYQDIIYTGSRSTRVSAVQATEVGYTQYANAYIIAGGIGRNNVTVRLTSARGYGYYFMLDIWGK